MKKITYLLSLVLFTSSAIAQSKDQKAIKKVVSKVIELNEAGKYKESLDYTYPALFDLVPREMLEAELDKLFGEGGELTIKMKNFTMGEVGKIEHAKTADYAFVPYGFLLTMIYNNEDFTEEGIEFVKVALEAKFGEGNVSTDFETNSIFIQTDSRMLAIKDKGTKSWKLLQLDQDQLEMYKMVLPEDIANEL